MSAQHTPGPWWTYADWQMGWGLVGSGHSDPGNEHTVLVCDTADPALQGREESGADFDARQKANARLIAAAPDLLAALKSMISVYVPENIRPSEMADHARDAIKAVIKAEGRS